MSCCCLEPGWFVGDSTPLARDNIFFFIYFSYFYIYFLLIGVVVSHITDSVTQVQGKWERVARVHDMLQHILTTYKHYTMEELCNLLPSTTTSTQEQEDCKLNIQQLPNKVCLIARDQAHWDFESQKFKGFRPQYM